MIRKLREVQTVVRDHPGIRADVLAKALGVDKRTALARAKKVRTVRIERGSRGRGHATRLWYRHDED